jgi:ubiquinone/menaquinone biosynthesis C-methylase UbiE
MSPAVERSSLARVLEPEAMDTEEDAHDYDAMDHGDVNRLFVADFLAVAQRAGLSVDSGRLADVLDVGTGTAQIPIELCAQSSQVQVVAIDLAESMLRLARLNVARRGFQERIALECVDAKRLPAGDGSFDAVISNSIVHHIPEPREVLAESLRVVRPAGVLFIRDLARPFDDAQVRHLVDVYAAGCNAHQRQLFDASLRAALSVEEIRELVARLGADPAGVTATSDRHWTWVAIKPR